MSKRVEEAALKVYPLKDYTKEPNYIHTCDTKMLDDVYRDVFRIGYELAEKDLGWHSVDEFLPPVDEEVIVLLAEWNNVRVESLYHIAFGHIVDKDYCVDYDGWNIPGVKYWMPMPKLKEKNDETN